MTQSELSQLIAALRAETQQNAVSPDSLGAILEKMVERIEQASAISPLEMRTLYLINGQSTYLKENTSFEYITENRY